MAGIKEKMYRNFDEWYQNQQNWSASICSTVTKEL